MSEAATDESGPHDNPILHLAHEAHGLLGGFESAEGLMHLLGGAHHATGGFPAPSGLGMGLGMLGLPLGGISMALGIDEVSNGEGSQGTLDIVSGGLGMASSASTLMALSAAPPLAVAAGVAGLASYGNKDAQADGWYGNDREGHHNTFLGSIRDKATDGQSAGVDVGHSLLGNNFVGDVAGGMLGNTLGALGGLGQTVMNTGAAVGTGMGRLASNEVDFVRAHPLIGGGALPGVSGAVSMMDGFSALTR